MSENDDTPNMTPLSSSSSGTSGTQAWNVSVDEKSDEPEVQKADNLVVNEIETQSVANTENGNFDTQPEEKPVFEPEKTPGDAIETAQEEAALTAETMEPVAEPQAASEADSGLTFFEEESETQTTKELREAILNSMADQTSDKQEEAFAVFERMSQDFSIMMKTARNDAAAFSFKLMEFAQENARNNFELARACTEARSIPEIFRLQADYMNRQLELLTSQAKELQSLTSELTVKSVADMKNR